jgi:imidazoleglycerol-phosphate dehydratase
MRSARLQRDTKETRIGGTLRIEGRGRYEISTGIRFFDHMLELFTKHGGFDLNLHADGDLDVDQHHTVEDVGIVLGQLFAQALGDRKGIISCCPWTKRWPWLRWIWEAARRWYIRTG